jgi:hypothetical protein
LNLTEPTFVDVLYICTRLRDCDAKEVFGMCQHDNGSRLAYEAHAMIINTGRGRIAWHRGRPAALAAFTESWPGNWEIWMFGTDDFKSVAIPLLRWFRKEANDILTVCKGNRLQCASHIDQTDAHRMIESLGGVLECEMPGWGKDGSTYLRYRWLPGENDAVLKPHYTRAA